jgi:hypothetical protein
MMGGAIKAVKDVFEMQGYVADMKLMITFRGLKPQAIILRANQQASHKAGFVSYSVFFPSFFSSI